MSSFSSKTSYYLVLATLVTVLLPRVIFGLPFHRKTSSSLSDSHDTISNGVSVSEADKWTEGGRVGESDGERERVNGGLFDVLERRERSVSEIGENETAGGLIYMTNKDLPEELSDLIVDMDIAWSRNVEEAMEASESYNNGDSLEEEEEEEEEDGRSRRGALNRDNPSTLHGTWPGGRVPYAFHPFVGSVARRAVRKAMDIWMAHTCIRFVAKTRADANYVEIVEMRGCWSYVGRQGRGPQKLSLGDYTQSFCKNVGVVLHELGHAVGFWHEQSRPDRDDYITVHWENIIPSAASYFWKRSPVLVDSLSVPYDYHSIMHYPTIAFTVNGEPTLVAKQPGVSFMGQRNRLSPLDVRQANLLYNCQVAKNDTEISINDVTNEIPEQAFQIRSQLTNTCLIAEPLSHDTTDTPLYGHYSVSMGECNTTSYDQYWRWNGNDSLVHLATLLCLTTPHSPLNEEDVSQRNDLFLAVCSDEMKSQQTWSCAGNFIEQPDTGKCLSLYTCGSSISDHDDGESNSLEREMEEGSEHDGSSSMSSEVEESESNGVTGERRVRRESLEDIAQELGEFLRDIEGYEDQTESRNKDSIEESEVSLRANYTHNDTMVSVAYCDGENQLEMWSAVLPNEVSEYSQNDTESENIDNDENHSICSFPFSSSHELSQCYAKNMDIISQSQWTTCSRIGYYVSGFYHIGSSSDHDSEGRMTGINCCATSFVFTGEPDSPPSSHREVCKSVEWWNHNDAFVSKGWVLCPRGMFLKGFHFSINRNGNHIINKAKCCRPAPSPVVYEHCYTERAQSVLNTRVHGCRLEGYHVVGIYKKRSSEEEENYVEEITCCMHT